MANIFRKLAQLVVMTLVCGCGYALDVSSDESAALMEQMPLVGDRDPEPEWCCCRPNMACLWLPEERCNHTPVSDVPEMQNSTSCQIDQFDNVWLPGGDVRVILLRKGSKRYSVEYDFGDQLFDVDYRITPGGLDMQLRCTISDFLRDQMLYGWVLRPGGASPLRNIAATAGYNNLLLTSYRREPFESDVLQRFVEKICPAQSVYEHGRRFFSAGWRKLRVQTMYGMIPGYRVPVWSVVDRREFLAEVQKETRDSWRLFILVKNHGIIEGRLSMQSCIPWEHCLYVGGFTPSRETLFKHKMLYTEAEMIEVYARPCIQQQPQVATTLESETSLAEGEDDAVSRGEGGTSLLKKLWRYCC